METWRDAVRRRCMEVVVRHGAVAKGRHRTPSAATRRLHRQVSLPPPSRGRVWGCCGGSLADPSFDRVPDHGHGVAAVETVDRDDAGGGVDGYCGQSFTVDHVHSDGG